MNLFGLDGANIIIRVQIKIYKKILLEQFLFLTLKLQLLPQPVLQRN